MSLNLAEFKGTSYKVAFLAKFHIVILENCISVLIQRHMQFKLMRSF